jgi:hypothetical protein
MNFVKLSGGLGNQMCQFAFARKLELKTGIPVYFDAHTFNDRPENITPRTYQLSVYRGNLPLLSTKTELLVRTARKLNLVRSVVNNAPFLFDPAFLSKRNFTYYDGVWVSPLYFEDIREQILNDFTLTQNLSVPAQKFASEISSCQSVSIHVRCGDYKKNQHKLVILGDDYYKRAIAYVMEHMVNPKFFLFTDDIEYARSIISLPEDQLVVVSENGVADYEEMHLMSLAKHNIIANSSFSFWGGWLNTHAHKIVVAPSVYKKNDTQQNDFIPPYLGWKIL